MTGPLDPGTVERLCREALGRPVRVHDVHRLRGGTKKGVFRVTTSGGPPVVLYVWHEDEDWWHGSEDPAADVEPFTAANGLELLTGAHDLLTGIGVRVPRILHVERRGAELPVDCAVVEDVAGGSLQDLLASDAEAAVPALAELHGHLSRMATTTATRWGKVLHTGSPAGPQPPFHEVVAHQARRHLTAASAHEPRLAAAADRVEALLLDRVAAVGVREPVTHGLVHGELGPDHVLIDATGRPVLVDLEGLMWADVEWEHAFLDLRFGEHYARLRLPGLDPARLALYRLALHLSLVEGPLRLVAQGFPDAGVMEEIAEHNLGKVLADVPG
ncbi:phosphotransferase [Kineococcus endophyticus]|uniref:Phosphotransferase n=1 Tax=Kineococcus endophyticus TaxID=1181883 RepID=A0ABV3P4I5_9ACTN